MRQLETESRISHFYASKCNGVSIFHRWNMRGDVGDAIVPSIYEKNYIPFLMTMILEQGLTIDRFLSVGAGCGFTESAVKEALQPTLLISSDLHFESCEVNRQQGIDAVNANAFELPFRHGAFDFVLVDGVLGHFLASSKEMKALSEIKRVLDDGGRILFSDDEASILDAEENPRVPYIKLSERGFGDLKWTPMSRQIFIQFKIEPWPTSS